MDLTITTNASPERYTIGVTGEVDISNASKLRDAIDLALEQPTEAIQLDFEHVAYIDSTGVGVLVGAAHHAARPEQLDGQRRRNAGYRSAAGRP